MAARLAIRMTLALLIATAMPAANAALQRGIDLFAKEDYKAAQKAFEDAAQETPRDPDSWLWLGRAYGRRAERATGFRALGALSLANKCRESFEKAIAIDPYHQQALEALFDYYVNAPGLVGGGEDKALDLIPQLKAADIGAALRARASLDEKQENYAVAEEELRQAIELRPKDLGHRLSLASFLARRKRYDESDALFAEAMAQHKNDPEVWFSRAKALVRAKRKPDEARRLLERYLATPLAAPDADPYSDARKLLEEL
ncbi:MAG: tetratricopeptide repeat protein [Bryobacterales bacterium]